MIWIGWPTTSNPASSSSTHCRLRPGLAISAKSPRGWRTTSPGCFTLFDHGTKIDRLKAVFSIALNQALIPELSAEGDRAGVDQLRLCICNSKESEEEIQGNRSD
jgi:hypothetical protein